MPKPQADPKPETYAELVKFVEGAFEDEKLRAFVRQSNAIERIEDDQDEVHLKALRCLLGVKQPSADDVVNFVKAIEPTAKLRDRRGRNVFIRLQGGGEFRPPAGGRTVVVRFEELVEGVAVGEMEPPEAHAAFEALHPFTDGNGRVGRALWVWHMRNEGLDPFSLPFLHRWYYQSLELARRHGLAAP